MEIFTDVRAVVLKYPLTFMALGAVCALAAPVVAASTSSALRPWAKRILLNALVVRREAQRIAGESMQEYGDLFAEVEAEAAVAARPWAEERAEVAAAPVRRVEPRSAQQATSPAA